MKPAAEPVQQIQALRGRLSRFTPWRAVPGCWGPLKYGPGQLRTSGTSGLAGRWHAGLAAFRLCRGAVQVWGSSGWARTSRPRPAERGCIAATESAPGFGLRHQRARSPPRGEISGYLEERTPGPSAHFCGRLLSWDILEEGRYCVTAREPLLLSAIMNFPTFAVSAMAIAGRQP